MRATLTLALVASALALTWGFAPASAQTRFAAAGGGAGLAWMSVGGSTGDALGPVVALQAGTVRDGARQWLGELSALPFRTGSPARDEGYRALTGLVGRSFGGRWTLTPALGAQLRTWSGPERVEAADLGLAWSLAAGTRLPLGEELVALPEVVWQGSSIELDGDVRGGVLALRVLLARGLR